MMYGYTVVASSLVNIYDSSYTIVSLCELIFQISYVVINYPASKHIEQYGLKKCMVFSGVLAIASAWLR